MWTLMPSPIVLTVTAVALGSLMDAAVKATAIHHSVLMLLFWRFVIGTILVGGAYLASGHRFPSWKVTRFHGLRGLNQALMALLFFYGVTLLPLAEATTLGFTAILMIAPFERLFLGEPMGRMPVLAALIGFAGVLIIMAGDLSDRLASPVPLGTEEGGADLWIGRASCLASAVLYALNLIMLRARAKADGAFVVAVYSNVMPAFWLAIPAMIFTPPLDPADLPVFTGLAILGSSVWLLMTLAYARAPAQKLSPFEYTSLLWGALLGWLFFQEIPSPWLWIGAVVIIAACLCTAMRPRAPKAAATASS